MNDIWVMIKNFIIIFCHLVCLSLNGKREIGELSVFDLVVNIMIAEMAVMAIDDKDFSIIDALVPILLLMIIQISSRDCRLKAKNSEISLMDPQRLLLIKVKLMKRR